MGLSSNILWHQTNFNGMRKILTSREILCSYSVEDTSFLIGGKTAFAMVSMCDLPFSELVTYLGKYGGYTIGLSRAWGIKHKFNPVWYCDPQSMAADALKHYIDSVRKTSDAGRDIILFGNILSYIKMVEGELPKYNYTRYRFYDEREVRFVPSYLYMINGGEAPMMSEEDYNKYKAKHNNTLLGYGVEFDWNDLKYIIVKEERQIKTVREMLTKHGCPVEAVQVFHNKQVVEDFIGENHNEQEEIFPMSKDDVKKVVEMTIKELRDLQQKLKNE